jgi:hypothetical protein
VKHAKTGITGVEDDPASLFSLFVVSYAPYTFAIDLWVIPWLFFRIGEARRFLGVIQVTGAAHQTRKKTST